MSDVASPVPPAEQNDARDLQARLYREIGISAVAAALRCIAQPDPDKAQDTAERDVPAILRADDIAA